MKIMRMICGKLMDFELNEEEKQITYEEERIRRAERKAREKTQEYLSAHNREEDPLCIDYEGMARDFLSRENDDETPNARWEAVIPLHLLNNLPAQEKSGKNGRREEKAG